MDDRRHFSCDIAFTRRRVRRPRQVRGSIPLPQACFGVRGDWPVKLWSEGLAAGDPRARKCAWARPLSTRSAMRVVVCFPVLALLTACAAVVPPEAWTFDPTRPRLKVSVSASEAAALIDQVVQL